MIEALSIVRGVALIYALNYFAGSFVVALSMAFGLSPGAYWPFVVMATTAAGMAFLAAIERKHWWWRTIVISLAIAAASLFRAKFTFGVSWERIGASMISGQWILSTFVLPVLGGFLGSLLHSRTTHWRSFNREISGAVTGTGVAAYFRGERRLVEFLIWFGFLGWALVIAAWYAFMHGLSLPMAYLVLTPMVIAYGVVFTFVGFKCSPNVSRVEWKYLAHAVGFLIFFGALATASIMAGTLTNIL
jgi:hypothetical protein